MRQLILAIVIVIPALSLAAVGVDVSTTTDSTMKVVYTGGSPTGDQPVLAVEGKKRALISRANNTSGARGVIGVVGTSPLPGTSSTVGVAGAGYIGVAGNGTIGVQGSGGPGVQGLGGYSVAVEGLATYMGVSGEADYVGVQGLAWGSGGWGVYGYADDWDYGYAGYFDGVVYSAGGYVDGSDLALKKNVRPLEQGLGTVMALKPKAYEMKEKSTAAKLGPGTKFGLIAQDVQALLPEVVRKVQTPAQKDAEGKMLPGGGNRTQFLAVNYSSLIPVLIKAMQEQQAQIEALESEVAKLRSR